jgi:hypothetical protein
MSAAAKSVYYFGYYVLVLSVILIVAPNFLLSTFQMPETKELWIHVLGVVAFVIGLYYVTMAPTNNTLFFMTTVYARGTVLLSFLVFVLIGWAPIQLVLFGLVDAAGAVWTFMALRKA